MTASEKTSAELRNTGTRERSGGCWEFLIQHRVVTKAGRAYFDAAVQSLYLPYLLIKLAQHRDFAAPIVREALAIAEEAIGREALTIGEEVLGLAAESGEEIPLALTPSELARQKPGPALKAVLYLRRALLEMVFCRMVDNMTTYLSEIIRQALRSRPKMLWSGDQIRVDYVLKFDSMDELREDLIDRKVVELSYQGFEKLEEWCLDRMGIKLVISPETEEEIVEFMETRNAIVHNRGKVGAKYLRNVKNPKFKQGELREIDPDYLDRGCEVMLRFVALTDEVISDKFGLEREEYEIPGGDWDPAV